MGVIKKLYAGRDIGSDSNNANPTTAGTEVYPITSAKAVYLTTAPPYTPLSVSNSARLELEANLVAIYGWLQDLDVRIQNIEESLAGGDDDGGEDDTVE